VSILYTGSAIATTAIGTLIPVLSDSGELDTPFGTYLLGAGAVGEFGPILLLTIVLSAQSSVHNALILMAFVAVALVVGVLAVKARRPTLRWFERTLEASSQLAMRWLLVLLFGLALLAYRLGLDLLLGGFAAGVIVRELFRGREHAGVDSKLSAIAFGLFVPFFFTVSGMTLDISAFATAPGILRTVMFCALMLLVRGTPAMVLYHRRLDTRSRRALALLSSTQLPLVLAITALATAGGRMSPSIAADLVGAALLSTLIFPLLGLRMRREQPSHGAATDGVTGSEALMGGDRSLGSPVTDERDRPARDRRDAVLEPGQEGQVHEQPTQPADEAGEPERPKRDHRPEARDRRHRPEVAVFERLVGLVAQPADDRAPGVDAGLHRNLGHPG